MTPAGRRLWTTGEGRCWRALQTNVLDIKRFLHKLAEPMEKLGSVLRQVYKSNNPSLFIPQRYTAANLRISDFGTVLIFSLPENVLPPL